MVTQNSDGSFTVTLADVYAEVRKLTDQVQGMAPQGLTLSDHEARLRSVERWKYTIPPSFITAVVSLVLALTGHH